MRLCGIATALLATALTFGTGHAQSTKPDSQSDDLKIYFIDVEGGQSTLYVAPSGQSLLIDTGWPGFNGRDADRIVKAAHAAGLSKIDTVVISHFHVDHVGGVPQLAAKIPIGRFIDHGPNREMDHGVTEQGYAAYQKVLTDQHIAHQSVHPGDSLDVLYGIQVRVVSSDGDVISSAAYLPPGTMAKMTPNSYCASSPEKPIEDSENDRSVGLLMTFGHTRILDLGDLTWGKERGLVCPANKLGQVDVYVASHHGTERSGSSALVDAIAPRFAVIDNGAKKGAELAVWNILNDSPRLKGTNGLWQLHTAEAANARNVDAARIANVSGGPDSGFGLTLTIRRDGSLSMLNERIGSRVAYPSK